MAATVNVSALAEALKDGGLPLTDSAAGRGLEALSKGEMAVAVRWLEQSVAASPGNADSLLNLGAACLAAGEPMRAAECFRDVLALSPESVDARYNLGLACVEMKAFDDAVYCFRDALRFRPGFVPALFALGHALGHLGRVRDAAACYAETLRFEPDHCQAAQALGQIRLGEDEPAEAVRHFSAAVARDPSRLEAWCNLAAARLQLGEAGLAEAAATKAVELAPTHIPSRANLAFARQLSGDLPGAIGIYEAALRDAPGDAKLHWNLALALLASGDWKRGLDEYEWRFEAGIAERRAGTVWDGRSCRRLLVQAEQGLGDTIQFARYLPMVAERCERVVFNVQPRLEEFFRRSLNLANVEIGQTALPVDSYIPLLSLPRMFGTRPDTIPCPVPWFGRPAAASRRRAGLCWSGNPGHRQNRVRSFGLRWAECLALVPGIEWVSLQRGESRVPSGVRREEAEGGTVMDLAALIATLHLVVTADTMVAHLAAVMGKPVWLLLPRMADWRWLSEGTATPWYPEMRLFRQRTSGDWSDPVDEARAALSRWVAT